MTERQQGGSEAVVNAGPENRNAAADLELIDQFLTDRLDREEREMVATRIVADSEFRREVELTEALRDGMRELAKRGEIAPLLAPRSSYWSRPPVAVAASVIAGLLAVNSFLLNERLDQTRAALTTATDRLAESALAMPTNTETLLFEHTRGGEGTPDVSWRRPPTPTLLTMRFDVGLEPAPAYTITIARLAADSDATVLMMPHIGVDVDGQVAIAINSELLDAGDYRVSLETRPLAGGMFFYALHVSDDHHE